MNPFPTWFWKSSGGRGPVRRLRQRRNPAPFQSSRVRQHNSPNLKSSPSARHRTSVTTLRQPPCRRLSRRSALASRTATLTRWSARSSPGFLNIDWRSGFADSNPSWFGYTTSFTGAMRRESACFTLRSPRTGRIGDFTYRVFDRRGDARRERRCYSRFCFTRTRSELRQVGSNGVRRRSHTPTHPESRDGQGHLVSPVRQTL